jgi:hypothetical protein
VVSVRSACWPYCASAILASPVIVVEAFTVLFESDLIILAKVVDRAQLFTQTALINYNGSCFVRLFKSEPGYNQMKVATATLS